MERTFSQTMSELRRAKGLSQRRAAADLNISQALLSHYENGAREPGLPFVCRACKYYGVTADFMLGLADSPNGAEKNNEALADLVAELRELTARAEKALEELEA
jgi:transcriptional regulator with XRE-family HTH domain